MTPSTYQTPEGSIQTRQYAVTFQNIGESLEGVITVDARNRFAKLELPAAGLVVVRQDLAASRRGSKRFAIRPTPISVPRDGLQPRRHTDDAAGARPAAPSRRRARRRFRTGRSRCRRRDSFFAQLAGQLAEQGFVVVRYDKRGVGQSGGRTETVTLKDYADDAVAAVKWLAKRKDVDNRRIVIAGYSEGAAVAMLAANEESCRPRPDGGHGNERARLILEQQQHALDSAKVVERSEPRKSICRRGSRGGGDRQGFGGAAPEVRQLVDAPLYRSVLLFEPEQAMSGEATLLILRGALDKS